MSVIRDRILFTLCGILIFGGLSAPGQESLPTKIRGGCAIIQVRQGPGNSDYSFCDKVASSQFAGYLGWLPDFLAMAFDNAERATCGSIRCAVGNRSVDLILVNSSIANAGVGLNGHTLADSNHLVFMFTTGMSDMTEAATISYLVQSNDPTNGLRAWLQRIDDRANTNCKFYVEAPYRSIDQQTFQMVRAGAQIYYQFILGHEFAHLQLGGPTCGSDSPEPLKQESTCDKFSFDHQWAFGNLAPNFVVVPLIALAHYDSLLDDRLGSFIYPAGGMTFREMFPAADWQARARQVAQWWTDKCSEPSQSNKPACKGSFQAVWADSKNYIELPMPHSCTDTDASRSSEMNPAGNMEGVLCKEITTVISDAASDFKNTLGPVDDPATPTDGGSWHSNRILPGAAGCTVFGRDANTGAFFRCDYNTTSDMAENDKLYSNLVNEISACFPKWTKETSQKTYPHSVESTADLANGSQNLAVVEKKRARTADIYIRIDAPENPK